MSSSSRSSRPTTTPNATTTARLNAHLVNHQRRDPVPLAWLAGLASCALRRLRIRQRGELSISFIDRQTMQALNRRFTRHNRLTDVLSFRYVPTDHERRGTRRREALVGEILIAPATARRYAARHHLPYREELARYVLHGLLHWVGHRDDTSRQRRRMRALEDNLLRRCA